MKQIEKGQVWLAKTHASTESIKPVLVVASSSSNSFIVVPLFTRTKGADGLTADKPSYPFAVELSKDESGLPHAVLAECDLLATLPAEFFKNFQGCMNSAAFSKIKSAVLEVLGGTDFPN